MLLLLVIALFTLPSAFSAGERIIVEKTQENINSYLDSGCTMRHDLDQYVSFECPNLLALNSEAKMVGNGKAAKQFKILDKEANELIGTDRVRMQGFDGNGVNVLILDTGVDANHSEFQGRIASQKDFVNKDETAEDDNGHGTHVAGIIVASGSRKNIGGSNDASGVAPGAMIHMLKVCDNGGLCFEDDILAALLYAKNNLQFNVVSISLGNPEFEGCDDELVAALLNDLAKGNVLVFAAAGNDGGPIQMPACGTRVIAVGAVDKNGKVQPWSNKGDELDILAPGVSILSLAPCSSISCEEGYATKSGTSMATPMAAGIAALLFSMKATAVQVKAAIYATAKPAMCSVCLAMIGNNCKKTVQLRCPAEQQGKGIVDAWGAYSLLQSTVIIPEQEEENNASSEICWSAEHRLLEKSVGQMRKFCSCVEGRHEAKAFKATTSRISIFRYTSRNNDGDWQVEVSRSNKAVSQVKCGDRQWYEVGRDYFTG